MFAQTNEATCQTRMHPVSCVCHVMRFQLGMVAKPSYFVLVLFSVLTAFVGAVSHVPWMSRRIAQCAASLSLSTRTLSKWIGWWPSFSWHSSPEEHKSGLICTLHSVLVSLAGCREGSQHTACSTAYVCGQGIQSSFVVCSSPIDEIWRLEDVCHHILGFLDAASLTRFGECSTELHVQV